MPRETYNVRVEVLDCIDSETAIATAAAKIAYADRTDTIGYAPAFETVAVHSDGDGPIGVTLAITVTISNELHREAFEEELGELAAVEQWEVSE